MHDDVEVNRSAFGEPGFLHQFQVRYRLLNPMLSARVNVAALMQGTIDSGKAKPRLDSDLFEGEFSHAGLATAEDNQSFIIILANSFASTETRCSKHRWLAA
jgi:hypothetical protein